MIQMDLFLFDMRLPEKMYEKKKKRNTMLELYVLCFASFVLKLPQIPILRKLVFWVLNVEGIQDISNSAFIVIRDRNWRGKLFF